MNNKDAKPQDIETIAQTTKAGQDWLAEDKKRKEAMRALFATMPEKTLPYGK